MPPSPRAALAAAGTYLPTLLVLALLGALGWWGATHDWKIGASKNQDEEKAAEAGPVTPLRAEMSFGLVAGPAAADAATEAYLFRKISFDSADTVTEAGIETVAAERRPVTEYVTANGEVDYDQNRVAHLGSRVSGTVWSVEKNAGDAVARNDVLALISSAEVGKIKAEFLHSLVEYQLKTKLYERVREAAANVPERQVREAEAQMREAHIRLFGEQQALLNLGLEIHLGDALKMTDEEVVQHLRTLGVPASVLRAGKRATLTNNNRDTLTNNLVPITSPFDGVVVKRDLVIGEQVNTQAMHFTVADLSRVWIMLNVRLEDAAKVREGQEVTFRTEGLQEEAPAGKLSWISAEVDDKTHTLAVRAEVPNPNGRLRPHNFGTGRIVVSQRSAVTVPNDAVQADVGPAGPTRLVFVRTDENTFRPRRVQVGLRGEKFTEILSGVEAGEQVAVAGSHRLKGELLKDRISGED
jgi:cobalt-zinc-cadmium efflux system membrane fusion protein